MSRTILRTGDHVRHRPSNRVHVIAYIDYETGRFAATGDYVGEGLLRDCDVLYRCNDDEHLNLLAELRVSGDPRGLRAVKVMPETIG